MRVNITKGYVYSRAVFVLLVLNNSDNQYLLLLVCILGIEVPNNKTLSVVYYKPLNQYK